MGMEQNCQQRTERQLNWDVTGSKQTPIFIQITAMNSSKRNEAFLKETFSRHFLFELAKNWGKCSRKNSEAAREINDEVDFCRWNEAGPGSQRSLNVLAHELPVELTPQRVVDEGLLFLVWLGPGAILEDDVVIPTSLDFQVGLVGRRRWCVFVAEEGIPGQNVFHPAKKKTRPLLANRKWWRQSRQTFSD